MNENLTETETAQCAALWRAIKEGGPEAHEQLEEAPEHVRNVMLKALAHVPHEGEAQEKNPFEA